MGKINAKSASSTAKFKMEEVHMASSSTAQLLSTNHRSSQRHHNDIDSFYPDDDEMTAQPVILIPATNGNAPHNAKTNAVNGHYNNDDDKFHQISDHHHHIDATDSIMGDVASLHAQHHETGHWLTLMNMIKANVGTGILAMPLAFKNSGLTLGLLCIVAFCVVCVECMQMVLSASKYFERLLPHSTRLTYPAVTRLAFHYSPLRRWSKWARHSVVVFLYITQVGFCCVYIVFVARTIDNVMLDFGYQPVNIRLIEIMLMPLFLLLVMVRNMNVLAKLMAAANVITFASLIVAYQEQARHLLPITSLPQFGSVLNFPRFFGTAIYAFEGIGCVLPVENKMRRPETFGGAFGVLNQAMLIVAILYATTGFLGYAAYGDNVASSITYNLPSTPFYVTVKIGMAVAIFFSYALQFYVPIKMISPHLRRQWPHNPKRLNCADFAARAMLMVLTMAFALFIPFLAEFIGLLGAFGGGYLALILPPAIDLVCRYDMRLDNKQQRRYGRFCWIVVKDVAILVFGTAGFVLGTYLAVYDIVEKFHEDATVGVNSVGLSNVTFANKRV